MPDTEQALLFLNHRRDELGESFRLWLGVGKRVDPFHLGDEPVVFAIRQDYPWK